MNFAAFRLVVLLAHIFSFQIVYLFNTYLGHECSTWLCLCDLVLLKNKQRNVQRLMFSIIVLNLHRLKTHNKVHYYSPSPERPPCLKIIPNFNSFMTHSCDFSRFERARLFLLFTEHVVSQDVGLAWNINEIREAHPPGLWLSNTCNVQRKSAFYSCCHIQREQTMHRFLPNMQKKE